MHSTTGPSGRRYHHNGDFSGAVEAVVPASAEIQAPPTRGALFVPIPIEDIRHLAELDRRHQREVAATKATWPSLGQMILVQDLPTTDAQRDLWRNQQPPTRKGEVVETPADGGNFLTIDAGGEYGGVTYAARDFGTRYTWKPCRAKGGTRIEADNLLTEVRRRGQAIRSGWRNPQYGTNIEEEGSGRRAGPKAAGPLPRPPEPDPSTREGASP